MVFARLGYSPQADLDFTTRLTIQEEILKELTKQYRAVKSGIFIADRTPVDFMAYTLAEVQRTTMTPELDERLEAYITRCADVCNQFFGTLIVIQPGIELVADDTKAPANYGYIEHINALVCGLVTRSDLKAHHFYINRDVTDLKQRVKSVDYCVKRSIDALEEMHYRYEIPTIH